MIPALVLTAGLATRLRPLSLLRAKVALPVAGAPLVHRILRHLAAAGVTDAVLNLHHRPDTISGIVGDGSGLGLRVRYSWENPVLGSAGGPRRALGILGRSPFLVVNGDTLNDVDVTALAAAHGASGALMTIAVVPHPDPAKYGSVAVDRAGIVTGLVPRGAAPPAGTSLFHYVGIYVADRAAFERLPDGVPAELREVILAHPGAVRAHVVEAEFFDIGTPADYLATSLLLSRREQRSTHADDVRIDSTARVADSVLWQGVVVEAGALVRECVVCDGATVPADTAWHGVTLRPAAGDPIPGEKRINELLVNPL